MSYILHITMEAVYMVYCIKSKILMDVSSENKGLGENWR